MTTLSLDDLHAQIAQLEAQRAELQAEADRQRNEAKAGVVQALIEQIDTYGITAKELGLGTGTGKAAAKRKAARKPLGARIAQAGITHTGPDGQTWTEGTRGRKPRWLTDQAVGTPPTAEPVAA